MTATYYSEREKFIRENWFQHHVPTFETQGTLQMLTWAKPGTSNYWLRFIISGRVLLVYGDAGDAIYAWTSALSWEWLAGLDFDYFARKCCASEEGRSYKEWEPTQAKKRLAEHFQEYPEDKKKLDNSFTAGEALASEQEWNHWLQDNGFDVFGGDYSSLAEIGSVHAMRCQGHYLGIQMALDRKDKTALAHVPSTA
jgi:hypothetical protein